MSASNAREPAIAGPAVVSFKERELN